MQVGGAEVVTGGLVVGVTRQDGRERRDRRLALSEMHLHQPETVRDVVRVGVEGARLAERGFGAVEILQRLQRDAELHVGAGNRGVQADRRAQVLDGAERVAALAEHDAEVVLRFGMPGIERHGALQRGQRAIEIARPPQRGAEMVVRVEELRRHRRRLAEAGDGVGRPSELAERETEAIAGAGHVRGPLERRFERGRGAGPVAVPLELDAAGESAWRRRRRRPPSAVPRHGPGLAAPAQASRSIASVFSVRAAGKGEHPWTTDRHDPVSPDECHDDQPRLPIGQSP